MPLPEAIRVGRPEKVRSVIEDMTLEALVELEQQPIGTALGEIVVVVVPEKSRSFIIVPKFYS